MIHYTYYIPLMDPLWAPLWIDVDLVKPFGHPPVSSTASHDQLYILHAPNGPLVDPFVDPGRIS